MPLISLLVPFSRCMCHSIWLLWTSVPSAQGHFAAVISLPFWVFSPGEYVEFSNTISLSKRQEDASLVAAVLRVYVRALSSGELPLGFCFLGCIRGYFLAWGNWRRGSFTAGGRGLLPNHSLLPAPVLCLLTKPCLLEALVFAGPNQVTGMCSCLVAEAISWSSRRREWGQLWLRGTAGTLRGRGGHYLPAWQGRGWELLICK